MYDNKLDLNLQERYYADVKEIMKIRCKGENPVAHVRTYGCQQNVADSEKIKGMLNKMGFSFTENEEEADFIIFNTCAVREHAEDRVFGNVGALKNIKRKNSSVLIAVCGCMMEQRHVAERIKKSFPFVNIVFGTHVIHRLPEMIYTAITDSQRVFLHGKDGDEVFEGLPIKRDSKSHAWLTVMYGCNNFCSYCIVPYVRGREKSRKSEDIIKEFKELVDAGYKEITLLGQNVNSYGKGLEEDINFPKLLKILDSFEGDYRIRFMTSHPKDATHEMFDVIANSKHISHHIHLPFQSGNNRVLKEMNRIYNREKYLDLIKYAKSVIPDLSLTSDVIVGFPGETYEEFKDTLTLIEEVEFTSLFTFIFSPRVGTKAEKMPDPITYEEKNKWFNELLKTQEKIAAKRCASMVKKTERVLIEEINEKTNLLSGRTDSSIIIEFEGSKDLIGSFRNVEVTEARNWILRGKLTD